MPAPKYPKIKVTLKGINGNCWVIMGAVSSALREGGVSDEEVAQYTKESISSDYKHLLKTAGRWVSVR